MTPWLRSIALLGALSLAALSPKAGLGQSLDHDSSQPIEISADSLEVEQEQQVATFAGNVDAVQGDLVLSADRLRVHYEGKESAVGIAAGSGNRIRRIDAEGSVIIASPEETAEGDQGTYDVRGKLVVLEGRVILTRGENVIRGERLVMDLVSGKSRIVGAETTVADGGEVSSGGRVRALFTPNSDEEANNPPVPEARPE